MGLLTGHTSFLNRFGSVMERIISSISRSRAIMSSNSTFQRIKAAEFLRAIEIVVSQLARTEGETAEISNLKDLLLLGESVSVVGGFTDESYKSFRHIPSAAVREIWVIRV